MKNELLERNEAPLEGATIDRPRQTRAAAPDVFRRQETFWKQVRQRIVEKAPATLEAADRLY